MAKNPHADNAMTCSTTGWWLPSVLASLDAEIAALQLLIDRLKAQQKCISNKDTA